MCSKCDQGPTRSERSFFVEHSDVLGVLRTAIQIDVMRSMSADSCRDTADRVDVSILTISAS